MVVLVQFFNKTKSFTLSGHFDKMPKRFLVQFFAMAFTTFNNKQL